MAKWLANIDLNNNQLQNAVVHPLATAPSSPAEGQIYYDNSVGDKHIYVYDGTTWVTIGSSFPLLGPTDSATAPNYSWSADSNTGMYNVGADQLGLSTGGTLRVTVDGSTALTSTLPLRTNAGTAGSPSHSFSGDTNTGMWNVGADQLGFQVGGTTALSLSTTALTMAGIQVLGYNGASPTFPDFTFASDTNTGMFSTGADGIGFTTGGTQRLAISTTAITSTIKQLIADGSATAPSIGFSSDTNTGIFYVGDSDTMSITAGGTERFKFGSTTHLSTVPILLPADPTNALEAATKQYVDAIAVGIDWKPSVRVATTVAGTLASSFENGDSVDGVTLATGNRILIKDQASGAENGIYVVAASGAPARATDADTSAEVTAGMAVFVEEGTTNADTGWTLTTNSAITLGSTALVFTQFTGLGMVTAGAGLTKTGSTIDVIGTSNRITVNANDIDIAATYVGQTSITTLGTITAGTWTGTTIAVANGGTGATGATTARQNLVAAGSFLKTTHSAGTTVTIAPGTHGLASTDELICQVKDNATGDVVYPDINIVSGTVTITFGATVAPNAYSFTIVGKS